MPETPRNDESKQPPRAEFRIGDDSDQPHQLPFKIIAVHENQKSSTDAPFHVRGGEWTFFDCQASKSSSDPMRIWWLDHKNKQKKLLRGPEKNLDFAEAAISPDHRYVVLDQWRGTGKERAKVLHIFDRNSGMARTVESQGKDLSLIGWKTTEAGLRAVAVTNRWLLDRNKSSESYLIDPASGEMQHQENVDVRYELGNLLSPDGKHRLRVGKDDLIVTNIANGQKLRFVFHEDDRPFVGPECIEWVSPRYLKFNGSRLVLIDVTTMKMCFPVSADGTKFGSHSYKFSSDFRWVLYQGETSDGEGLFLASVEVPN